MAVSTLTPISPAEVHPILARHNLAPAEADAALEIVRKSLKEL
jgi:hypothetical protein